ncbi:MAG: cadmium-translocating P-type ATPase [Oscillospiraceae bacterium]|nr:cadmium-translocating P-type ATPase [Oscillospiraceae bacterium]
MKKKIIRIAIGIALLLSGIVFESRSFLVSLILFAISFIVSGYDIILKAFKNIIRGKVFDENFLMSVAAISAFCIGEYLESAAVVIFYQIGETFQNYAVSKSRKSVSALMDIKPDFANLKTEDGILKVAPQDVKIGDIIIIRPGEKVPLDGVIVSGNSSVDCSPITGESIPADLCEGNEIISGCVNMSGVIFVKVTKEYSESTVNKILDLIENAISKKSKSENFITEFARIYSPIVTAAAVLVAIIPPLLFHGAWYTWIYRALSFLVVSCPCALVISIPLSFFGGIGRASKLGILIKGGKYVEILASLDTVVFDKTGTLTTGAFSVSDVIPAGVSENELLRLAAHAEAFSNHPISNSIKSFYGTPLDLSLVSDAEELPGYGISATVEGKKMLVGNSKLMSNNNVFFDDTPVFGAVVHVAADGEYLGKIVISDTVKQDAFTAIKSLRAVGINNVVMLTGDNRNSSKRIADSLGIDKVYSELLPEDKVSKLEEIASSGKHTAFIGDGINDAPALARADVGIAMGAFGSDAAIEAADVVLMNDAPSDIAKAVELSKHTMNIVKQNIVFSLSVKLAVFILISLGLAHMWLAVFADVGIAFLAILNALRTLK